MSVPPTPTLKAPAPPLLLSEALGFSPQLLIDDIVDIVNESAVDAVEGMDTYIEKWREERAARSGNENWDGHEEVEQGLVSFQTLLEYHADMACDAFEAWSLRNIFAVPPELPIVLPHHEGLDLTVTAEREAEIMDESQILRDKIKEQRRLKRELTMSLRVAEARKIISEKRIERLHIIDSPTIPIYASLPAKLLDLYSAVTKLPEVDPESLARLQLADPGKQKWETGKVGYLNWAVEQLLAEKQAEASHQNDLAEIARREAEIGTADQLKQLLAAFQLANGLRKSLGGHSSQMDTS